MRRQGKRLFIGFYNDDEGENFLLIAADQHSNREATFKKAYKNTYGVDIDPERMRNIYLIHEAYDYDAHEGYRIRLRKH
jgi:hypothetical protein